MTGVGAARRDDLPQRARGPTLRIDWRPGTDLLRGTCHCGAVGEAEDPVLMWEWLLAHPRHTSGLAP